MLYPVCAGTESHPADEEARNHASILKDSLPLGRRSGQAGIRGQF